jgi:RimJ/RimL family protein N-acetyltransferase
MIFAAYDGQITDRGSYLVIRTPSNPTFYWGNFLLFSHAPQPGDYSKWRDTFAMEIGAPPQVRHETFGWDTTTGAVGAIQPFLAAGFHLNQNVVLTAQQVHPPPNYTQAVTVRPLSSDGDWEQALANQIRCREPDHDEAGYALFKQRQMARYRDMAAAGLGAWFGVFIGGQLVADSGIFHHQELARFQEVETHPDYRRRGIGGTMVYAAARYALAHFDIQTLVIVADRDSAPARLYASIGFETTEQQVGLEWWEK